MLVLLLGSANGCLDINLATSCFSFPASSMTTSNLPNKVFSGCTRLAVACNMNNSQACFSCRSTSCTAQVCIIINLIMSTFFESSCVSINSGTPSKRNSRKALLLFKEKSLDLFLSKLKAAAAKNSI